MTTSEQGLPAVRSDARGRHWVAWVPDDNGNPRNSVVLVAATREEAERRAREWARTSGL
ncbi:MAG: hypothetical protein H0X67_09455 [Acidobacteria bacterium]|nr:hypothetical protein [Acidobacteriota bacterium]